MNLVIVESPSKAKTINKYLGKDYFVIASKGHLIDLPKSKMGIDTKNDFEPTFEVTNKKQLDEIKKKFKEAKKLILAVDMDREGEAIGWHIAKELINKKNSKPVERIVFNEISKKSIEEAIKNPRDINMDLVNAQMARRFLDRLVGYTLSPLLWKKISFGLSAGRVQSAALRLVVEREEDRNKFKSREYWSIKANLTSKSSKNKVDISLIYKSLEDKDEIQKNEVDSKNEINDLELFELTQKAGKPVEFKSEEDVNVCVQKIKDKKWFVSDIKKKSQKKYSRPPFITSTLQQTAVNFLGFSSKKTMQVAQKLYENGFITYMRTDSTHISNEASDKIRSYIKTNFGRNYLPQNPNFFKTSNKSAQEAHECIRPVDINKKSTDLNLDSDQLNLYDLIWRRTVASQMVPAEYEIHTVFVTVEEFTFKKSVSKIIFDGFQLVTKEGEKKKSDSSFKLNQEVFPKDITGNQHFTQPPPRFSEATLIKKMEELGIGRPSTYSSVISTILSRKYIEIINKYLKPTDIGIVVNKLLSKYFYNIVDYKFTAEMEDSLDLIAEGKKDWKKMLKTFFSPFESEVKLKDKEIDRSEFTNFGMSEEICPECGSKMVVKLGRYGKFLSCSKYPECKGMLSIGGESSDEQQLDMSLYQSAPKTEDGREYVLKVARFGKFWAHPDYPKVKDARPLLFTEEGEKEMFGIAPKTKNNKSFILKKGKYGYFWAHPDYPKVKEIRKISKKNL